MATKNAAVANTPPPPGAPPANTDAVVLDMPSTPTSAPANAPPQELLPHTTGDTSAVPEEVEMIRYQREDAHGAPEQHVAPIATWNTLVINALNGNAPFADRMAMIAAIALDGHESARANPDEYVESARIGEAAALYAFGSFLAQIGLVDGPVLAKAVIAFNAAQGWQIQSPDWKNHLKAAQLPADLAAMLPKKNA